MGPEGSTDPPPTAIPYRPTEAIDYGWRKFSASPATLLVPMIVAWLGIVITVALYKGGRHRGR